MRTPQTRGYLKARAGGLIAAEVEATCRRWNVEAVASRELAAVVLDHLAGMCVRCVRAPAPSKVRPLRAA